jgi:excisionase family DNA binding protein
MSQSVAAAARQLGVSDRRVRQLLAAGKLRGERFGRDWVVDSGDLERHRRANRSAGRPWRPAAAWAVLALANGQDPDVSAVERSRARRRLADRGLVGLADSLRDRATFKRFYGHPAAFERLLGEPGVVAGGVTAAGDHGVGLVGGGVTEAYVSIRDLALVVERYALEENSERPNLFLRVVDDDVWPFEADTKIAPRPVVALDLLEAEDERSRRAGFELAGQHP